MSFGDSVRRNGSAFAYVGVVLGVIAAILTAGITWGQMNERMRHVEKQQDAANDIIGDVRKEQERVAQLLSAVDTRTVLMEKTQQRILNTLEAISKRPTEGFQP